MLRVFKRDRSNLWHILPRSLDAAKTLCGIFFDSDNDEWTQKSVSRSAIPVSTCSDCKDILLDRVSSDDE